jgi:hypothetical protein
VHFCNAWSTERAGTRIQTAKYRHFAFIWSAATKQLDNPLAKQMYTYNNKLAKMHVGNTRQGSIANFDRMIRRDILS